MKMNLKNRFLLPTLAIILIGMGLSAVITHNQVQNSLRTAITGEINQISSSTARMVDSWIKDRRLDAANWSRQKVYQAALGDSFMAKSARKNASGMFTALLKDYSYYETLGLADSKGDVVAASNAKYVGQVNIGDRSYFKASMAGKAFLSPVIKSRGTDNPVFVISAPVEDRGAVKGVFFSVVDLAYFSDHFVTPLKVGEKGYAYVFQDDGGVIAHPDKKKILEMNMNDYDFGRQMIAMKEGISQYTFQGVEKLVHFKQVDSLGWTVAVAADLAELEAPVDRVQWTMILVTGCVAAVAAIVIWLLVRSIVVPINRITASLREASNQVGAASSEIASASQSLAGGASEQAASIEETSSSLEEMASMTRQNASNAAEADNLMEDGKKVVSKANDSMQQLTQSMAGISQASEETSKIIKTIDEIAFQTNLLALNAAVEAARAGEAGAGFAVVADEVRNLAMRAADAAKNTAGLIEETTNKVREGSAMVLTTNEAFSEVSASTTKVAELVREITAASNEQAAGIDQISKTTYAMDQVVQNNAANAEESASASEELSAQSEQMDAIVNNLMALVSGQVNGLKPGSGQRRVGRRQAESAGVPDRTQRSTPAGPDDTQPAADKKSPEQLIPFKDDGFSDF